MALVLKRAGKRYNSITLEADSRHLMTDVWTTAGVLVGILMAFGLRHVIHYMLPTQVVELTVEWAAIAGSLGLAGGLLGSVYPALRASRLDPVQALNFE